MAKRQADGVTDGTINRELTTLKRMFTLAVQGATLAARPHIALLRADSRPVAGSRSGRTGATRRDA